MDLFEKYYLPLKKHLIPCLSGLILALLPGIEEKNEFYERVLKLLDSISENSSPSIFHYCVWKALLGNQFISI